MQLYSRPPYTDFPAYPVQTGFPTKAIFMAIQANLTFRSIQGLSSPNRISLQKIVRPFMRTWHSVQGLSCPNRIFLQNLYDPSGEPDIPFRAYPVQTGFPFKIYTALHANQIFRSEPILPRQDYPPNIYTALQENPTFRSEPILPRQAFRSEPILPRQDYPRNIYMYMALQANQTFRSEPILPRQDYPRNIYMYMALQANTTFRSEPILPRQITLEISIQPFRGTRHSIQSLSCPNRTTLPQVSLVWNSNSASLDHK
jgi:hypothetical protein